MNSFYDALETRSAAERLAHQLAGLPAIIAHAKANAPMFAKRLLDVDPQQINSLEALAQLPVTRKTELLSLQKASRPNDPFGGVSTVNWTSATRVFASPGTLYEPETARLDYWRMARAMFAAGFRSGQLVHNCFSYHFTPAGSMLESGAFALGCAVFPGGVGQTEQQLAVMQDLRPSGYVGTPSFLKILLEKAEQEGIELPFLTHALVSGEAFPASLRDWFTARGVQAYQAYATADLGLIAYETSAREGLVLDEHMIVEIVRPGTPDPVAHGEVGEVVVTTFNPDYPLIRFGTGDLSAFMTGQSPCGRTQQRIKGWMGRADQTTKIRGMFVHPEQVADVVRRFPQVQRARLVVSGQMAQDHMVLHCETATSDAERAQNALEDRLQEAIRDVTKLRGHIQFVAPGTLPNDGKVIEDARSYE